MVSRTGVAAAEQSGILLLPVAAARDVKKYGKKRNASIMPAAVAAGALTLIGMRG